MDSLTQAVLGAAVGEAVAGPRLGRRAAFWGAVAGTLPDLDILAYPLLDTAGELQFHRGITHGLPFAFVVGPLLGYAVWRLERWRTGRRVGRRPDAGSWRTWTAVFFWALLTHPLLDLFTVYGTQLLAPFSDHPFAIGSVFIIDPLYTLPLAASLVAALVARQPERRRRWAAWGLAVSTAYLGWSLVAQSTAHRTALRALAADGVRPARVLTTAAPLTTLLWRTTAEVEAPDGQTEYLVGLRSLLDRGPDVAFDTTAARLDLLAPVEGSRDLETLRWFSRGWLLARDAPGGVDVSDLRFGRTDGGLGPGDAPFIFTWRLVPTPAGVEMAQADVEPRIGEDSIRALWNRIRGRTSEGAPR